MTSPRPSAKVLRCDFWNLELLHWKLILEPCEFVYSATRSRVRPIGNQQVEKPQLEGKTHATEWQTER